MDNNPETTDFPPRSSDHISDTVLEQDANTLADVYKRTRDGEALKKAIGMRMQLLERRPVGHTRRAESLFTLGNLLRRYCAEQRMDEDRLQQALVLLREALSLTQPDHYTHSSVSTSLARALLSEFERTSDPALLSEAIVLHRRVLPLRPPGHPARDILLVNLANALKAACVRQFNSQKLDEAIELYREALDLRPAGHAARCATLNHLAYVLRLSFDGKGDHELLDEYIGLYREALESLPSGHPKRDRSLINLASSLITSFEKQGGLVMLGEVINLSCLALELHPLDHPARVSPLNSLANALLASVDKQVGTEAVKQAITLYRNSLDIRSPARLHGNGGPLANLTLAMHDRLVDMSGVSAVLVEAINLNREALQLSVVGHSARDSALSNLGRALLTSYEQHGDVDTLAEVIALHREALDLRPIGHRARHLSLSSLAIALLKRFEVQGGWDNLAGGISFLREALDLHPPGHPMRGSSLVNLANSLVRSFEQQGGVHVLSEAVALHWEALSLCPPGNTMRDNCLNNLANALSIGFEQSGDSFVLEQAIALHREALHIRSPGHSDRVSSLNNLAETLLTKFEYQGDLETLAEATDLSREALDLSAPGDPHRSLALLNLGDALSSPRENQPDFHGLEESLELYQQGLQSCTEGHPSRVTFLFRVGDICLRVGTPLFDLKNALNYVSDALACSGSSARHRLRCGISSLRWIEYAYRAEFTQFTALEKANYNRAMLDIYLRVVRLLPLVASFAHNATSRLQELNGADALSRNAAGRAMNMGQTTTAVEILEEGRGVFWLQALCLRVSHLDGILPQEQHELKRIFRTLDDRAFSSAGMSELSANSRGRQLEERRRLSERVETLIANIRSRPGLERFLMPPAFVSLLHALPVGFIVMLVASDFSHRALILDSAGNSVKTIKVKMIPGGFASKAVVQSMPRDASTTMSEHGVASGFESESGEELDPGPLRGMRASKKRLNTFEDVLADLWMCVVKPVLDALNLKKASGQDRPRVWWCATGDLTFLPIHAAGGYTEAARTRSGACDECAADYIVSSYIPSLSALSRASASCASVRRSEITGLLIHEPSPGASWNDLDHVEDEVNTIKGCFEAAGAVIVNDTSTRPSVAGVLAALSDTPVNILHLACHGAQKTDPLQSAFILHDGDLAIKDLMKLDLKEACFAFLSACQTAKGLADQPDQAVHLAASMLFCGFKSVIGTMWSMADVDGPDVAGSVYATLFRGGVLNLDDVPYALDEAVTTLREQNVPAARWALFVHMGA